MLGDDHSTLYSALNVSHNAIAKSNRQPMLTKQYSLSKIIINGIILHQQMTNNHFILINKWSKIKLLAWP